MCSLLLLFTKLFLVYYINCSFLTVPTVPPFKYGTEALRLIFGHSAEIGAVFAIIEAKTGNFSCRYI